jgi:hypothetical protein
MLTVSEADIENEVNSNEKIYHNILRNAFNAANKLKLWEWFKEYEPNKGFMWDNSDNTIKMQIELDSDGHSGCTFAIIMRVLQQYAKQL